MLCTITLIYVQVKGPQNDFLCVFVSKQIHSYIMSNNIIYPQMLTYSQTRLIRSKVQK